MASQKDSNPNVGGSKGGGMKNVDGREMGSAYNKQNKPDFKPKDGTGDINSDVPSIGHTPGLETGAY